jgi:peptidylprolyl isomerase
MMKQKKLTTRLLGLVLLLFLGGLQIAVGAEDNAFRKVAGGVMIKDLKVGSGLEAKFGQVATIHFTGWVDNGGVRGEAFFDSREQGQAVSFVIGTDKVMPAWNVGVLGMKPGGERQLLIPPAMGYGARSIEDVVPANADLVLNIELIELKQ